MKKLSALLVTTALTLSTLAIASPQHSGYTQSQGALSVNAVSGYSGVGSSAVSGGGAGANLQSSGNASITSLSAGSAGSSTSLGYGRTVNGGGDVGYGNTGRVYSSGNGTGNLGGNVGYGGAQGVSSTSTASHADGASVTSSGSGNRNTSLSGEAGSYSLSDAYNGVGYNYSNINVRESEETRRGVDRHNH